MSGRLRKRNCFVRERVSVVGGGGRDQTCILQHAVSFPFKHG